MVEVCRFVPEPSHEKFCLVKVVMPSTNIEGGDQQSDQRLCFSLFLV